MPRVLALAMFVLASCASGEAATDLATPASEEARAAESTSPPPPLTPTPPSPIPTKGPHQAVVAVIEVVAAPASEADARVVALRLRGDVGTSAIFRTLEIRATLEPIEGSSCDVPPEPTLLRPSHPDAVAPVLADQTRDVIIRPQVTRSTEAGAGSGRFQSGPVPSLNGAFEGWVSFHVPVGSADGFCAFDVSGMVVVVAGETITTELPVLRVDTRVRVEGR